MKSKEWRRIHREAVRRLLIGKLCHWFLAPLGRLRKPRPRVRDKLWEAFDFPICPHCGQLAMNPKACYFCGQRFTEEE